jgi:hypothetical protein
MLFALSKRLCTTTIQKMGLYLNVGTVGLEIDHALLSTYFTLPFTNNRLTPQSSARLEMAKVAQSLNSQPIMKPEFSLSC